MFERTYPLVFSAVKACVRSTKRKREWKKKHERNIREGKNAREQVKGGEKESKIEGPDKQTHAYKNTFIYARISYVHSYRSTTIKM